LNGSETFNCGHCSEIIVLIRLGNDTNKVVAEILTDLNGIRRNILFKRRDECLKRGHKFVVFNLLHELEKDKKNVPQVGFDEGLSFGRLDDEFEGVCCIDTDREFGITSAVEDSLDNVLVGLL